MKPKFVYFDLGGVTILDFSGTQKWEKLKTELGVSPNRFKEFDEFWDKYEPELCTGRDTESLIPLLQEQFGSKLPHEYSLLIDGFVNRFKVNRSIWPLIEKFHNQCPIGLLTNMYPNMLAAIKNHELLPPVSWDIIIDSSIEKVQKPDLQIYELAQRKADSRGNEILFVENTPANLQPAQALGWQTFLYDSANPEKSSEELNAYVKLVMQI